MLFVEPDRALQRPGCVETDANAAVAAKFLLCSTQKLFGDSVSLPLRQYRHATKMPFFRGDDLTADCAHDRPGVCDRHENGHAMEPFMDGIRREHSVFESLRCVALAIRLERCLQTLKNSIRVPRGSSPDRDARYAACLRRQAHKMRDYRSRRLGRE